MAKTHCIRGHAYAEFGKYRSGRECRECKRIANAQLAKERGQKVIEPWSRQQNDPKEETVRSNRIMGLIDKLNRASMSWEREDIQAQINALRKSGTPES